MIMAHCARFLHPALVLNASKQVYFEYLREVRDISVTFHDISLASRHPRQTQLAAGQRSGVPGLLAARMLCVLCRCRRNSYTIGLGFVEFRTGPGTAMNSDLLFSHHSLNYQDESRGSCSLGFGYLYMFVRDHVIT